VEAVYEQGLFVAGINGGGDVFFGGGGVDGLISSMLRKGNEGKEFEPKLKTCVNVDLWFFHSLERCRKRVFDVPARQVT
jgi:hypothetical protein